MKLVYCQRNGSDEECDPLVEGKRLTGFTNSEEEAVGLTDVVPFFVEDEFKTKGGRFERGEDWGAFIVTDGLLTIGQSPASSSAAAKTLLEKGREVRSRAEVEPAAMVSVSQTLIKRNFNHRSYDHGKHQR